ncbi:MAG: ISAs1 family transposase [Myxacorys chilensis ATA2-1-KO14]|jgi:predicted transposase YbfD/YdcC|nr:ISAs1 family transposase [Myxacorys chilensis ATA2-1-KO14]
MRCTPKKTVEQIIESGNDYIITVKGNQPKLYQYLQAQFEKHQTQDVDNQTEQARNRITQRTVSVLDNVEELDTAWVGVRRFIRVERIGIRGTEPTHEAMFYISSVAADAKVFSRLIRDHWHIENRLHWVKDVVFKEDLTPICSGHAPENMAILRTIALNLFRLHEFTSITKAIRAVAHDVRRLFCFFQ